MDDIKDIRAESGLHEPSICQSCNLKKLLHRRFGDEIGFYNVGNHFIVYSSLDDIKDNSEETGLHKPFIHQSCNLKKLLQEKF